MAINNYNIDNADQRAFVNTIYEIDQSTPYMALRLVTGRNSRVEFMDGKIVIMTFFLDKLHLAFLNKRLANFWASATK
jgi:hypothetical protein